MSESATKNETARIRARASKRYALPDRERCVACGACANECPRDAIEIRRGCFAVIDPALCVGCGRCAGVCPTDCIALHEREATA